MAEAKQREIKFHISQERYERMTLNDLIAFEDLAAGQFSARALRDVMTRFLMGDKGTYLPAEEAQAVIGALMDVVTSGCGASTR